MKWSFKLGRILGIDVYVHFTFLLFLGFVCLTHWFAGRTVEAMVGGGLFFLGLFACVLLHEYGHALAARRYGIPTRDITLLPIGGVARLERMPSNPAQELVVALAGPAVNVVIAIGLVAGLILSGQWQPVASLTTTSGNLVERLLMANVFLTVFNLLPAFPMDGGRVLRSLLAMRMEHARATNIAARIGQGMAVVFGFVGLFANPMLLLIALFVWVGAAQEAAAAEMKSNFSGATVREAMLTDYRTLAPQDSLEDAIRLILAGSQRDFPVVVNGAVVGILAHGDIFGALRDEGSHRTVDQVMRRDFATLGTEDCLETALAPEKVEKGIAMPVMENSRLVGLLTAENLGEFFMIRAARAGARRNQPPRPPILTQHPSTTSAFQVSPNPGGAR